MSQHTPGISDGNRSFAELLDFHLKRGTHPKGNPSILGTEWTNKRFADLLLTSERNVRNWRSGRNLPSPEMSAEISQALFRDNPLYAAWISELREASRRTNSPGKSEPAEVRCPRNLPFGSLGPLFKGREQFLDELHAALNAADGQVSVVGKAVHGLGGIGKTRLAVEYAIRHQTEHSALLFVQAESPTQLNASLAALSGRDILDLPEKQAREDDVKVPAVIAWLERNPGWLMILDDVDDGQASKAVTSLLARLRGGGVIITGRMSNFPASIRKLELDVLATADAATFLLERTQDDRVLTAEDESFAYELAEELGGLALGLEQAGAYISTERISLARYLELWRRNRETVISWFDKDLMTYNHDTGLAATWLTSVEHLSSGSRQLMERLAFFSPEPIPDSLLDVIIPSDGPRNKVRAAISELYAYSLLSRVTFENSKANSPGFTIHRLVQDFTRRHLNDDNSSSAVREGLEWVNAGFTGCDPSDVRFWPKLNPLIPHALALVDRGHALGIQEPTAELCSPLGSILNAKARFVEAEHALRHALTVYETLFGLSHTHVAGALNQLAALLGATNRTAEAELLFRRALMIEEANYGPDHPEVGPILNNLAMLLRELGQNAEAEVLLRRSISIAELNGTPDDPSLGRGLNNLGTLLPCGRAGNGGRADPSPSFSH